MLVGITNKTDSHRQGTGRHFNTSKQPADRTNGFPQWIKTMVSIESVGKPQYCSSIFPVRDCTAQNEN
jgi:hypothetical protein